MNWFKRLRFVFRKDRAALDLDDELRFHVEQLTRQNIAAGMSPEEARYAALREFGGVEQLKEECRSARGMDFLDSVVQDLRYAVRNFRRNPAFALTVVAVTAIGIGATTAVFSVVDRVIFRGLPYYQPDRLVSIGIVAPILEYDFLTATTYLDLRRNPGPLESVTSWAGAVNCDLTDNQPMRMACAPVDYSFLPVLGIQPLLGRNFTKDEDAAGSPGVALISHDLWKSRFAAQPGAIGQRISIDGRPVLVLGVLAPDFEMPALEKVDVLVNRRMPDNPRQGAIPSRVYGRMKPGVALAQVQAMDSLADRILAEAPPQYRKEVRLRVRTLEDLRTGDLRLASWTLLAAVLGVLLIACANVANLLLARSTVRQRELSIRVALGAGRARIVRQTLTETLLLSLTGGAAGCLAAAFLLQGFRLTAPVGIAHLAQAELDLRVLLFALATSIFCGVVFGLAPAFQTPRPENLTGARSTATSSSLFARHILVSAQLAASLVLLTCAGLLLQSLWQRLNISLGMRADHIVTAQVSLGVRSMAQPARLAFLEQIEQRLERLPGVEAVAISDSLPPGGVSRNQPFFALRAEGRPPYTQGIGGVVVWRHVTPGYFRVLGIPVLRGRTFTEEDRAPNANTIVISDKLAKKLFPGEDALGKQIGRFPNSPWLTVIGIVADVRNAGLSDINDPEYYVVRRHSPEDPITAANVIVRGTARPEILESWIRAEIAAIDPSVPPVIRVFEDQIRELAARPRFLALLLLLFAAIGLILAGSGLYGLISYLAAQREREIGVRLALGATPSQITGMMLRHALRWTAAGLFAGMAGSAAAAYSLRSILFHVSAADPLAFGAAALVLVSLAAAATLVPSRRAAALDPMATLRQD